MQAVLQDALDHAAIWVGLPPADGALAVDGDHLAGDADDLAGQGGLGDARFGFVADGQGGQFVQVLAGDDGQIEVGLGGGGAEDGGGGDGGEAGGLLDGQPFDLGFHDAARAEEGEAHVAVLGGIGVGDDVVFEQVQADGQVAVCVYALAGDDEARPGRVALDQHAVGQVGGGVVGLGVVGGGDGFQVDDAPGTVGGGGGALLGFIVGGAAVAVDEAADGGHEVGAGRDEAVDLVGEGGQGGGARPGQGLEDHGVVEDGVVGGVDLQVDLAAVEPPGRADAVDQGAFVAGGRAARGAHVELPPEAGFEAAAKGEVGE